MLSTCRPCAAAGLPASGSHIRLLFSILYGLQRATQRRARACYVSCVCRTMRTRLLSPCLFLTRVLVFCSYSRQWTPMKRRFERRNITDFKIKLVLRDYLNSPELFSPSVFEEWIRFCSHTVGQPV